MGVKGYTGKILRADLSTWELGEIRLPEETLRAYLGGTALGSLLLYESVPPRVGYDHPQNIVFIGAGPLNGTAIGGSGSISIVTKGALTGGATSSQANGLLGAYLKFSGFDGVLLTGRSEEWCVLELEGGEARLHRAGDLRGLDTYQVAERVEEKYGSGPRTTSTLSIGPAGEKQVRWAGAFVDKGHSASHNGTGAVLGSKGLKALVAHRGEAHLEVHDEEGLRQVAREIHEDVEYFRGTIGGVHRMWRTRSGALPVKNYSTYDWGISPEDSERFDEARLREKYQVGRAPCWGCTLLHSTVFRIPDGPYKCVVDEPEYEQMAAWGPLTGITDVDAAMWLSGLTDRLGLDNNEAGWVVAWVMEGCEEGWLGADQLGFQTGFGDPEGAERILRMVASREGFGDTLAEGVKRASQALGGAAAQAAVYTAKGNTPRGHDHRTRWAEMFDTCVSNTGTIETHMSVMSPEAQGPENPLEVSSEVARTKGLMQLEDSAVTCRFNTRMNHIRLAKAISHATGWDMSPQEAWDVGRRAVNLMRCFNLRAGLTKEHDRPSPRYGSTPVDGPSRGRSIAPHWEEMLEDYYRGMGWTGEGVPKRETLARLGLEWVWGDIAHLAE